MILVDTSVWIDHLRSGEPALGLLLQDSQVLGHPFVLGEIALGQLRRRAEILALLAALPPATVATDAEVLGLIEQAGLAGTGIGYVDAHLLAAVRLSAGARIWTRDRRLAEAAGQLSLQHTPHRQ